MKIVTLYSKLVCVQRRWLEKRYTSVIVFSFYGQHCLNLGFGTSFGVSYGIIRYCEGFQKIE
jgi:hypothetical protein